MIVQGNSMTIEPLLGFEGCEVHMPMFSYGSEMSSGVSEIIPSFIRCFSFSVISLTLL